MNRGVLLSTIVAVALAVGGARADEHGFECEFGIMAASSYSAGVEPSSCEVSLTAGAHTVSVGWLPLTHGVFRATVLDPQLEEIGLARCNVTLGFASCAARGPTISGTETFPWATSNAQGEGFRLTLELPWDATLYVAVQDESQNLGCATADACVSDGRGLGQFRAWGV